MNADFTYQAMKTLQNTPAMTIQERWKACGQASDTPTTQPGEIGN